jgi:hypothetical protein
VWRQFCRGISEVSADFGDRIAAVVDPLSRRHVAPARGDEHQQGNAGARAAIGAPHNRVFGKSGLPVKFRARVVQRGQQLREPLVGGSECGVDGKGGALIGFGRGRLAAIAQEVGKAGSGQLIVGGGGYGLLIGGLRGGAMAGSLREGGEFEQSGEMGRIVAD